MGFPNIFAEMNLYIWLFNSCSLNKRLKARDRSCKALCRCEILPVDRHRFRLSSHRLAKTTVNVLI